MMIAVAVVGTLIGAVVPAQAADFTIKGSALTEMYISEPRSAPDWAVFAAQSCGDVKDGVQEAVLNGIGVNGKTITVKVTGATQGGPSSQKLLVVLVYYSCSDVATTLAPPANTVLGSAYPGHDIKRTISASSGVKAIVLENFASGATGITYTFCAKASATAACV